MVFNHEVLQYDFVRRASRACVDKTNLTSVSSRSGSPWTPISCLLVPGPGIGLFIAYISPQRLRTSWHDAGQGQERCLPWSCSPSGRNLAKLLSEWLTLTCDRRYLGGRQACRRPWPSPKGSCMARENLDGGTLCVHKPCGRGKLSA